MSTTKRPPDDPGPDGPPPRKKIGVEPLRLGPVSTLEEMDIKVLQYQHKKLSQVHSYIHNAGLVMEFFQTQDTGHGG